MFQRSSSVAIVLGPEARRAWEKAGSQQIYFGQRIVAARLKTLDPNGRPMNIVLASTYAPDSSRAIGEHEEFEADKQRLYDSIKGTRSWWRARMPTRRSGFAESTNWKAQSRIEFLGYMAFHM